MSSPIEQIKAKLKAGEAPEFDIPGWSQQYPPYSYQSCAIAWLYLTPKALLLDATGTGKTLTCLALLQYLKSKGELGPKKRALIIVPAISVYGTWAEDGFKKFVPDMKFAIGRAPKAKKGVSAVSMRKEIYNDPDYEVLLMNYEMVRQDIKILQKMDFDYVILDEAEIVRNPKTQTHKAVKKMTSKATRVIGATATPIQTHLMDLHGLISIVGLEHVLGNAEQFKKEYHKYQMINVRVGKKSYWTKKFIGYQNTALLKQRLNPYYLRRTYKDLDGIHMPHLTSHKIYVELTQRQKELYRDVQNGYLGLDEASNPLEVSAAALRLRQICTSTAAVMEDEDSSAKMDKLMSLLDGDWVQEKVIVFSNWKSTIAAMEARLRAAGIGFVTITSDMNNQKVREERRQQFWNDPKCRVMLGTTAIERSLNLQCARVQVNLDYLYNASRHNQLAGRIHRIGSDHQTVFVFSFIASGTIEHGILKLLEQRQALSDHILDEESDLFEALSTKELIKLIGANHGLDLSGLASEGSSPNGPPSIHS